MRDPEGPSGGQDGIDGRLDSWKEIAAFLNRHVTTVRRWERQERLPVHRHLHDKLRSVYAFRGEVQAWWDSRRVQLDTNPAHAMDLNKPAGVAGGE